MVECKNRMTPTPTKNLLTHTHTHIPLDHLKCVLALVSFD